MGHSNPKAVEIITKELCNYNCGQPALYKFANGTLCCSKHYNSCPGKRKQFSEMDHSARTAKSLETRIRTGVTKSSQIKATETRKAMGFYEKQGRRMQELWEKSPWNNNLQCPLLLFKDTTLIYQGSYELIFLEKLENIHGLDWIRNNVSRGPSLWYDDPAGKERLYISDFIIGNTIYEVKSGWTWNRNGKDTLLEELNKAKLTRCIELGYNVILVLNGEEISYVST